MRLFCKHSYVEYCRVYAKHIETGKDITFAIEYKCVNCGKILRLNMEWE